MNSYIYISEYQVDPDLLVQILRIRGHRVERMYAPVAMVNSQTLEVYKDEVPSSVETFSIAAKTMMVQDSDYIGAMIKWCDEKKEPIAIYQISPLIVDLRTIAFRVRFAIMREGA